MKLDIEYLKDQMARGMQEERARREAVKFPVDVYVDDEYRYTIMESPLLRTEGDVKAKVMAALQCPRDSIKLVY